VVVDDFEIGGCVFIPSKADAVLSIDPNAKFADTIAGEYFEMIARRLAELIDARSPSDNRHLPASNVVEWDRENSTRGFSIVAIVDVLGTRIPKIRHIIYNACRYISSSLGRRAPGRCCDCSLWWSLGCARDQVDRGNYL
jgi:hypothetical protein